MELSMDKHFFPPFIANFKIKYLWFFVTNRCNLRCNYCFYKNRKGKETFDLNNLKVLFRTFKNLKSSEFVISGGEPCLEWNLTCQIINYLRERYKNYILIQTNGVLLDKEKLKFLSNKNVGLEIGLDGTFSTVLKSRGCSEQFFERIVETIGLAKHYKLNVYSTMTVLPEITKKLFDNFNFLVSLGFKKIEITPAAFEKWGDKDVQIFINEYKKIVQRLISNKQLHLISTGYDKPLGKMAVDLICLPNNTIMTNWALLSAPPKKIAQYSMFWIDNGRVLLNKDFLYNYFKKYLNLFSNEKNITYRDFSNLNALWIYHDLFGYKNNTYVDNYLTLGAFQKKICQRFLPSQKATMRS